MKPDSPTFSDLFRTIFRRYHLIGLCSLIGAAAGFVAGQFTSQRGVFTSVLEVNSTDKEMALSITTADAKAALDSYIRAKTSFAKAQGVTLDHVSTSNSHENQLELTIISSQQSGADALMREILALVEKEFAPRINKRIKLVQKELESKNKKIASLTSALNNLESLLRKSTPIGDQIRAIETRERMELTLSDLTYGRDQAEETLHSLEHIFTVNPATPLLTDVKKTKTRLYTTSSLIIGLLLGILLSAWLTRPQGLKKQ